MIPIHFVDVLQIALTVVVIIMVMKCNKCNK